ncbi:Hydrolase, alpha/beta fold family [hydrothermal vent metagenome]|uniref:Hydrolase, alpha/beta fold family n=1 Tax=hydrothermal vent metagenome TaxID=652676 RepID=A0A3B0ZKU3_9ZZZZ
MLNKHLDSLLDTEHDFESIVRTPLYFGPNDKRLIGWLHKTNVPLQYNIGVVICPPLGVEYVSTYRSMRYVADYFALAGIPAFRFDYHGTGDSSGSNDDGNQFDDWLWSIEQASNEIKRLTGCEKVGLMGLRMGGTLAALAAEKIEIDFLVLWAALESGRKFIREIRAIQMTGLCQVKDGEADLVEAGGMVYWPETVDAIQDVVLVQNRPKTPRILIVPRDDFKANTRLIDAWEEQGCNVEQIEYPGSADMLLVALDSVVPHNSIVEIVEWVHKGARELAKEHCDNTSSPRNSTIIPSIAQGEVKESFVNFGVNKDCFAILSEPVVLADTSLPIIVIVNSGANHRVGPSRLYVTIARELACLGFRSLRIDIPGLGDSIVYDRKQENKDYIEASSEVIHQAMKSFGVAYKENKYVVTGLCSGAYFSFHAALDLDDVNIVEGILINPLTFYWHEGMEFENSPTKNFGYWNWYKQAIKNPKSWKKLLRGGSNYAALFDTVLNRIKIVFSAKTGGLRRVVGGGQTPVEGDLNKDLMKIASSGRHLSFILAKSDPGYDVLMTSAGKTARKLMKDSKINIIMIEDADHTFSKYKPRCDVANAIVKHITARYLKV